MIYVTVGSTHFDELVMFADRFARARPGVAVVCQIGSGNYKPTACEYFRYAPDHWAFAERADLVVTHGGTGSVSRLIRMKKPFIAVANRQLQDDHQVEFLSALAEQSNIIWVTDPAKLEAVMRSSVPVPCAEIPSLAEDLLGWIQYTSRWMT